MKNILYIILILINLVQEVYANDKIAIVNIYSVFQQLPQRAKIIEQLENEFKSRVAELQSMEYDLQTNIQKLQKEHSELEDKERIMLEKSVMIQRETFNNKAQEFEQENQRRQNEERNKLLENIQKVIHEIAMKNNYNLVIDSSVIAYAKEEYKDITLDVLKKLK